MEVIKLRSFIEYQCIYMSGGFSMLVSHCYLKLLNSVVSLYWAYRADNVRQ